MMDWSHWLVGFISFFLGGGWNAYTTQRDHNKYKWACEHEGCGFSVSSPTNPEMVVSIAASHAERHYQNG